MNYQLDTICYWNVTYVKSIRGHLFYANVFTETKKKKKKYVVVKPIYSLRFVRKLKFNFTK